MPLYAIIIYLIASIITTTFFSAFIQSRGKGDYVKVIFLLSIAIDFYMFGYILELMSDTLEQKLFWNYFQYLGIPFISGLWLTVGLMYTNHFYRHMKLKLFLIYAIPVQTFILRFTNNLHHLYFSSIHIGYFGQQSLLVKTGGIGYTIQGYHSGLMIVISMLIYISAFIRNKDFNGEKINYMIGASVIACFGLTITGGGMPLDYTVLCLPVTMLLVLIAIFRNDFLEVRMIARDLVFESTSVGIIVLNKRLKILDFNETAKEILKDSKISLEKRHLDLVIQKENPLNEILKTSITKTWTSASPGGDKYYEITTTSIFNKNGAVYGIIKTFRDITEIKLRTDSLKVQATVDELSGLLNRRAFVNSCQSKLNSSIASEDRFYLLMLDLDFFKRINDTYGHAAGDHVIESFGRLLKLTFKAPAIIGRLGGEEFAVFLKEESIESAFDRADQFRKTVEAGPIPFKSRTLRLTVSIGISGFREPDDISSLINKADKALYISKNNGRNKTSVYEKTEENGTI